MIWRNYSITKKTLQIGIFIFDNIICYDMPNMSVPVGHEYSGYQGRRGEISARCSAHTVAFNLYTEDMPMPKDGHAILRDCQRKRCVWHGGRNQEAVEVVLKRCIN